MLDYVPVRVRMGREFVRSLVPFVYRFGLDRLGGGSLFAFWLGGFGGGGRRSVVGILCG